MIEINKSYNGELNVYPPPGTNSHYCRFYHYAILEVFVCLF